MRRFKWLGLGGVLYLAACGGGGTASAAPTAGATPSAAQTTSSVFGQYDGTIQASAVAGRGVLVNGSGKVVVLHGANMDGLDTSIWLNENQNFGAPYARMGTSPNFWNGTFNGYSDGKAAPPMALIKSSGFNAVRIALSPAPILERGAVWNDPTINTAAAAANGQPRWINANYDPDPQRQYLDTLDQTIALANQAGLYVVLSMQSGAYYGTATHKYYGASVEAIDPDATVTVNAWKILAARYGYPNGSKPNRAVIFDLFTEPQIPQPAMVLSPPSAQNYYWKCWANGCPMTAMTLSGTWGSTNQAAIAWQSAGMTQLLGAVRGSSGNDGALNVVLMGGENYCQNFNEYQTSKDATSGWLGYVPAEAQWVLNATGGHPQIAASLHAYTTGFLAASLGTSNFMGADGPSGSGSAGDAFERTELLQIQAAGYPIVAGEFGDLSWSTTGSNVPAWMVTYEANPPFAQSWIPWLVQNNIGFMAWTWNSWGNGYAPGNEATAFTLLKPTALDGVYDDWNDGFPTWLAKTELPSLLAAGY